MKEKLYLGTKGDIRPMRNRVWKLPFFIGLALLGIYLIYEVIKLSFSITADMTIHADYMAELLITGTMNILVPFMLVATIGMIATVLAVARRQSLKSTRIARISILVLVVLLILLGVLGTLRFIAGARLLHSSIFPPYEVWIYRFYEGVTLVLEWKVIPDMLVNLSIMIGVALMVFSMVDLVMDMGSFLNVMETGSVTNGEILDINGERFNLDCKIKDGIKACKIE